MTIAANAAALCANYPPVLHSTQVGTKTISYSSGAGDDDDFADIDEIFDLDASFVD